MFSSIAAEPVAAARPNGDVETVNQDALIERLFATLVTGDRNESRSIIAEVADEGIEPETIAHDLFWPVLENVQSLFRADQLSTLAHHYAMRLLRQLADQSQANYTMRERNGRRVAMFSGASEADELAAQMTADLLEAAGFEVFFGGGGIANDEVLGEIGQLRPDILLMFSSGPNDAPNIRQLIDHIRSVGACPDLQIAVGGGIFNRAEGLAQEIGADIWARDPRELIEQLDTNAERRATNDQRTVGRNRRNGNGHSAAA